jgi:hypothetical protein
MLKDNRIPPEGFLTTSNVYDTVRIVGAENDPDFNISITNGQEGTGRDYVHYHVPIGGYSQPFSVYAYIYYQAIPPEFLTEMFAMSSAEIDTFESMYNSADQAPFLVGEDSLINIALGTQIPDYDDLIKVGPSPTNDGYVNIYLPEGSETFKMALYEANGKYIKEWTYKDKNTQYTIQLPQTKGNYILSMSYKGKHFARKLVRN